MPAKPPKKTDSTSGKKVCFNLGDSLKGLPKLNALLKKAKAPKVTQSYVFREGAKRIIAELIVKAEKALQGSLHAKRR